MDVMDAQNDYVNAVIAAEVIRRRKATAGLFLLSVLKRRKELQDKKVKLWSRQWLLRRDRQHNVQNMIFEELGPEDPASFTNYTRMQEDVWNELLVQVMPYIEKQDTVMRQAIPPKDRLIVTLRYLATGNTFQDLSYSTRIDANTISKIIDETLNAIIRVLDTKVWNFPSTPEEWELIAHKFDSLWNFPHCIGALDGKHINFRPARRDGSLYRNYKGKDSIILLGLVDAEYRFLFVDVGKNGRMHDSTVFRETPLGTNLYAGKLNLPVPSEIPGFAYKLPFVIVGDDAFALKPNLLKPYPDQNLTLEKRVFNYRLSRARRTVENAFEILANRWRVLLSTLALSVEKVEKITYSCVLLHNYLLIKNKNTTHQWYVPENYKNFGINNDNCERARLSKLLNSSWHRCNDRASDEALEIRNKFCEYFNTAGAVPFQYTAIERGG